MSGSQRMLAQELAALGLDLESTLNEEPRFLLDARFLGALHSELAEQLGEDDARAALLQMGFLHGLRDAALLLASGFGPSLETTPHGPTAARLAIRMEPAGRQASLSFSGSWPERHEAEAVLECLGRRSGPICHVSSGYTAGWLSGILDADMLVVEESCGAHGASGCRFNAREAAGWIGEGDPAALRQLEGLPFGPLRETVARHLETRPAPEPDQESFEAGAPVVHVWGPVMVLPFSGPDESLRALELIGRDPGARQVRVVVVDLSGTLVDEGFGASALEQVLDGIESWGAEPLLTGVSPLSERVVAGLEHSHLVVHKDLPEAIAAAFQIADAQRVSS